MNVTLLKNARLVRKNLKASRLFHMTTIRDAVELAADNMRQIAHKQAEDQEI